MFMNTVIIRSHHDGDHDDNYDNDEGGNHKYEYDGDYGETVIMATKMMIVVVGRIMIILWKVLGRVVSDEDYGISDNDDENDNDDDDEDDEGDAFCQKFTISCCKLPCVNDSPSCTETVSLNAAGISTRS